MTVRHSTRTAWKARRILKAAFSNIFNIIGIILGGLLISYGVFIALIGDYKSIILMSIGFTFLLSCIEHIGKRFK
jgi:hypothetical protein